MGSSDVAVLAPPTGVLVFCSDSAEKFGASVGHGSASCVDALAASSAAWVTVVVTATPVSCASTAADPVSFGAKGSAPQPVGAKSGDATDVSVRLAYVIVTDEDPAWQLVGMRVNGLPPSVPLIVSDIWLSTPASAPRLARSRLSTV